MHGHMNEDAHMLCKVLDSMAAQALELKKRILMGKHVPSWADYKIYKACDSIKAALGSTFSMKDHMHHKMPVSVAIHKLASKQDMQKVALMKTIRDMGLAGAKKMSGRSSLSSLSQGMTPKPKLVAPMEVPKLKTANPPRNIPGMRRRKFRNPYS